MSAPPPNSSQQRPISPTASTSQQPYTVQGQQGPVRSGSLLANSNAGAGQQRTRPSMTSSGSSGSVQSSHMESTITRLLVATKQLLEGLAKWSRGEISEDQISEIYVKLGNDFNVACAAFAKENIGMNELLSVPSDLRVCLETCLSETPSQATLERHLPKVRQIIIGLLHGLREKQRLYRDGAAARREREREEMVRRGSGSSAAGGAAMQPQKSGQGAPPRDPLTPNSANRSRDELRKFVTQAKASAPPSLPPSAPPPAPSSSSRPAPQPSYPSSATVGAPSDSVANLPPSAATSPTSSSVSSSTLSGRYDDAPPPSSSSNMVKQSTRSSAVPLPPSTRTGSRSASGPGSIGSGGASLKDRERGEKDPIRQARSVSESIDTGNTPNLNGLPHSQSSSSLAGSLGNYSTSNSARPRPSSIDSRTRAYSPPPPPREPEKIPLTPTLPESANGAGSLAQQQQHAMDAVSDDGPPRSSSVNSTTAVDERVPPSIESVSQSAAQIQSLEALKASDNLSRRASKRYSAYTIQKMTGTSGSSPLRGIDGVGRSGMTRGERLARGSEELRRANSSAGRELADGDRRTGSGSSKGDGPRRSKSEFRPTRGADGERRLAPPPLPSMPPSLSAQSLSGVGTILEQEEVGSSGEGSSPAMSRQGSGGPPSVPLPPVPTSSAAPPPTSFTPPATIDQIISAPAIPSHVPLSARSSFSSPSEPSFPLTVFIQLGRDVKKARLESAPTHASLRMLFIQRFQYNPGSSGDFPAIYVRDRDAGIHYELEELSDVREGSVLSLNIDDVQQVKNHIDQGLSALAQEMKELKTTVTAMRRVSVSANSLFSPDPHHHHSTSPVIRPSPSERQFQDAAQKVLKMRKLASTNALASPSLDEPLSPKSTEFPAASVLPAPVITSFPPSTTGIDPDSVVSPTRSTSGDAYASQVVGTLKTQHAEVQNLRREIGVLRQVYLDFASQTKEAMSSVRVQTSHVATLAGKKLSGGRQFVEAGLEKYEADSQDLVMRVDYLSDMVDSIRHDTVKGIRVRPQQLNDLSSQCAKALKFHKEVEAWAAKSKAVWGTTWSDDLARVINEQDTVADHEAVMIDIGQDLADIQHTLGQISTVAVQEKGPNPSRQAKVLEFGGGQHQLRHVDGSSNGSEDGATPSYLLEVQGLRVDPERRLEAIAKAEKARELELASRTDEFADELGGFVSGGKLKKSGGIEETERLRQARSEATLKAMFAT